MGVLCDAMTPDAVNRHSRHPRLDWTGSPSCPAPVQHPIMAQQLITIPATRAFHLPPGGAPVLLAEGDLVLSLIPAHAPDHPRETITLTVGTASFPITHATPVVKVDTNEEHPSFAFRPVVGGERAGKVKVVLKESTGPAEYERTEAMAMALEKQLKELGCWKEMGSVLSLFLIEHRGG